MLRFGRMPDRGIKSLTGEALTLALADAGLDARRIESAWFANSGWGANGGQDSIRGEVALRAAGMGAIKVVNVENACAGGATALHGAWLDIASGEHEVAIAIGAEKLVQSSRLRTFASFLGGMDVEALPSLLAMARSLGDGAPAPKPAPALRPSRRVRRGRWASIRALPSMLRDAMVIADRYHLDLAALAKDAARSRLRAGFRGDGGRSPFMDVYAIAARRHMAQFGSTARQLAVIAAKNRQHGSLNPLAQVQRAMTPDEVLVDALVASPLTRAMCAPIGDGAAAAIVCSERFARTHGLSRAVRIRASVLTSGARNDIDRDDGEVGIAERASRRAYEIAGLGPDSISLAEVHDATAFGELHQAEALGFCAEGQGGAFAESGATRLGGRQPLNTSGGLESRGHPIAASGLAQVHELVTQLRGEAGPRQVQRARVALAQNGGGFLGAEEAAMGIHVLEAP